jgi:hypothetical protein
MNSIISQVEEKLGSVHRGEMTLLEFFEYWTSVSESHGDWGSFRSKLGESGAKRLAMIFDKFSAIFSEQDTNEEICEGMAIIANCLRNL